MGRLRSEYNNKNCDEGLNAYIKEKEKDIIFKWQNDKDRIIRKKTKKEEINEKVQKV